LAQLISAPIICVRNRHALGTGGNQPIGLLFFFAPALWQLEHGAWSDFGGHDLDMAIAEKPVPIVLGPSGKPYVIDHHHVAAALRRVSVPDLLVVLAADLSSLKISEFRLAMENRRWAYPYDVRGQRRPFSEMPRHVWRLEDDVCRSLAAFAREAGAYEKTGVPLEDFRWADFFRSMLPLPKGDEEFEKVLNTTAVTVSCYIKLAILRKS